MIVETIAPLPDEELLHILHQDVGSTISVFDRSLRFRYVNDGFAHAFNFTPQQMVGMRLDAAYGKLDFVGFMPQVERALAGETVTYERFGRMQLLKGIWRTVSMRPWRNTAGEVIGVVTASLVVEELKRSTEALRAANERLASHMDNSPLTVLELDARLNITRCSSQITKMLGLDPQAVAGQTLLQALGIGPNQEAFQLAFAHLQAGHETRNRIESSHLHADGASVVHCEWFNSALTGPDGQVASIMALVEDVSVRVRATEQLRKIARHDPLTGLLNRSAMIERLGASLARAQRTREPVALLFLDLDGFKRVNDEFGHAAGDEVLRVVAGRLVQAVRESDVVSRWGGDEFVVLLETDAHEGTPGLVCERVFAALQMPCEFSNGQAAIGASIGVARHPPLPNHAAELIKCADAAMYEAKRVGKGCVRYAASTAVPDLPPMPGLH